MISIDCLINTRTFKIKHFSTKVLIPVMTSCALVPVLSANATQLNLHHQDNFQVNSWQGSKSSGPFVLGSATIVYPVDEKAVKIDAALYPSDSTLHDLGRPAPNDPFTYFGIRQVVLKNDLMRFIEWRYYGCVNGVLADFGRRYKMLEQCALIRDNALKSLSTMPQVDFSLLDNDPTKTIFDKSPIKAEGK